MLRAILVLGGLAFAASKFIKTAKAAIAFEYDLLNFKVNKTKTSITNGLVGTLNLSIYNPSATPVIYQGFFGNLYYNGERVGNVDPSGQNITIAARSNTVVPVEVVLPISFFGSGLIAVIDNILSGKKINKTITLKGLAKMKGLPNVEITENFSL